MLDCLTDSALAIALAIKARKISPVEVMRAHIQRIEATQPFINALVANRFAAALKEAKACETKIHQSKKQLNLPPFFGVPCTIKESFQVAGMPNSGGLWSRRHIISHTDATVVQRLRQTGMIVMGVSNVPEGGLWLETYNRLYGRTNNPWNIRHTAGGSSGGEAALVACGASPMGLASDMGGSIRIPAAFCGVVGHKPTGRMLPNTGYWPPMQGEANAYLTPGLIGRRIDDMAALLPMLAGPDGIDNQVKPWDMTPHASLSMRDVVVYTWPQQHAKQVSRSMRQAMQMATDALVAAGVKVATAPFPKVRKAAAIWSAMVAEASDTHYSAVIANGNKLNVFKELLKIPWRQSNHTSISLMLLALEKLIHQAPAQKLYPKLCMAGRALQAELEQTMGANGILLYPPYSRPAPRHRMPLLTPLDFAFSGIFNVLEFPVTQVPTGFDKKNLPIGVQIAACRGNDHLTLATARVIEQALGGWQCAPVALPQSSLQQSA